MSDKRILPAFLLAFFFGALGVHRFYVGKVGSGLIMLAIPLLALAVAFSGGAGVGVSTGSAGAGILGGLMFAMLLGSAIALWWLVDLIRILVGSFTDKSGAKLAAWT